MASLPTHSTHNSVHNAYRNKESHLHDTTRGSEHDHSHDLDPNRHDHPTYESATGHHRSHWYSNPFHNEHHLPRINFWKRLQGKNRESIPSFQQSLKAVVLSSWLNIFLVFIPIAWVSHFLTASWGGRTTFALCFLAMIPLEGLFEFGGEQMAIYCGKTVGDLVIVTLNNSVEAALAIILLTKCELKLLQSTVSGVILLHLLLIPGVSFLAGGAQIVHQNLNPHSTQLNHSLLTVGILALLIPTAFFAALDPGAGSVGETAFLTDGLRADFLRFSRGLAVLLLVIYLCSRFFIFDPPGEGNALVTPDAPAALREKERELAREAPKVNPWFCMGFLLITVAIMAATAEFLVDSIETVLGDSHISKEWFGVILLPLVSFSGDGVVAIIFFLKTALSFKRPETPSALAKSEAIDMSIQFTLFWLPFLVLLGWWTDKPLHLLFDLYEVALLVGACFLVNYVTADSKTNWAEGFILSAFYVMIALVTWYYDGQGQVRQLLQCESVAAVLQGGGGNLE